MTEAEVLAYLLQHKKTTPPELVRCFKADILGVHQALLRLERKGLVKKTKIGRNVEFRLTEKAERLSQQAKQDNKILPFIFFLGFATFILLIALEKNKNESERD